MKLICCFPSSKYSQEIPKRPYIVCYYSKSPCFWTKVRIYPVKERKYYRKQKEKLLDCVCSI